MKILTGNDLASGDVIWWTGGDWSRHVSEAADVGEHGEGVAAREAAALRVNEPYVIDATATPQGPRPAHIKDRIRAVGPTVRPDFAIPPADPAAGSWTI